MKTKYALLLAVAFTSTAGVHSVMAAESSPAHGNKVAKAHKTKSAPDKSYGKSHGKSHHKAHHKAHHSHAHQPASPQHGPVHEGYRPYAPAVTPIAHSSPALESHFKSGFYVGVAEGVSLWDSKLEIELDSRAHDDAALLIERRREYLSSSRKYAVSAEGVIGGRYFWSKNWSMGLEVAANLGTQKNSYDLVYPDSPIPISVAVKNRYKFIPSLTLGYAFNQQWNVFAKIGLAVTNFELSLFNPNRAPAVEIKKNLKLLGFAPSLGIEYSINSYLSVVGMLGCEIYKNKSHNLGNFLIKEDPTFPDTISNIKSKSKVFTQKIGLVVKF